MRPAIVLAGFGVTRLVDPVTKRYVWGTARSMWHTRYADDLDLDPDDRLVPADWVGSRSPMNTGWQLSVALRKFGGYTEGVDLFPFHYDWRRSARENGKLLRELIERVRGGGRVDLVTHSAGSLVALAADSPYVENIVMVAPVRRGSTEAFRVVVRPERFIRRTFPAEMVATFPFVFEMLPEDGRVFIDEEGRSLDRDLWSAEAWPPLSNLRAMLADARKFRDELPAPRAKLTVLSGDCVPTARKVLARRDGTYAFYPSDLRTGEQHLVKIMFAPGDGTALADADAMLFCSGHQGLASDPSVHRAIIRALRE